MKTEIQALPALYNGITFRSRIEARWAIFFDHCGMKWEYEPECYKLEDGTCYLPDFLLHDLVGRVSGDLFVEVKGQLTAEDAKKISRFIGVEDIKRPLLLVGNIFTHGSNKGYIDRCFDMWMYTRCPLEMEFFSYVTIDKDCFGCVLGVNHDGQAETFGADSTYRANCDESQTESAFRAALNAQFTRSGRLKAE